jgi:hypothetical protein
MAGVMTLPAASVRAETAAASACRFEAAGTGKVRAIIDGRSFALDDGREIRLAAIAYVKQEGAHRSAAHEMLGRGFARVSAHVGDRACANELLAQERTARQAKLGLWGEPYYVILGADSTAELAAERGHFTVVEGKVSSVRESGGTIYVNFGRRWSQALTVTIPKRHERTFAAAGMEPKKLENRRVRVRGWLEERNGPRIEAAHPEQIEIAERN